MNPYRRHKARFILLPVFVVAVLGVLTLVVRSLWNGVLADVVAVKPVTYWQALGLLVLAKILFGGFPGRGRHCGPPWRKHFEDECASLPPEQRETMREKMREEMRKRFGAWPSPCWGGEEQPRSRDEKPQA